MKRKITDIICLSLVAILFGTIVVLNIIQKDRPTVSEAEKRELASMPEFSADALKDGSYFSGIAAFISDTFLERDRLVGYSKQLDALKGYDYSVDGEDAFVMLGKADITSDEDEEAANDISDALAAAFQSLENKDNPDETFTPLEGEIEDDNSESESQNDSAADIISAVIEDETGTDNKDSLTPDSEDESQSGDTENAAGSDTAEETEDSEKGLVIRPDPDEDETTEIIPDETNPGTETPEGDSGNEDVTEPEEPEIEFAVTSIKLSREILNLTIGSGAVISAKVDTTTGESAKVKWSISDKEVASIALNSNGGVDVKAVAAGECTVTCRYEDIKATCKITVSEITTGTPAQNTDGAADFLTDGMFILGDAVYTQAFYSATNAGYYAQAANYYKQLFGDSVNVSVVVAPVSSMVIDNPTITAKIADQKGILDKMSALMGADINFVDAYTEMYSHRSEYLFFKSDHHWTARGAYYAYRAFAKSLGFTPTELDGFDYVIRNDSYSGSMYMYTQDYRVKSFTDTIEAFIPRKKHTMTVTGSNGATYNYNSSVVDVNKTYVTFIAGDNPYTVINVPDNPQDRNILVLKDSFGNAFVPFLCEHFGNIIVADVRYYSANLYNQLKDYGLTDIVFVNNIQAANSYSWSKMYLSAVGVYLP